VFSSVIGFAIWLSRLLQSGDFAESPQVSFSLAVLCREERLNQVPRDGWADSPATHAQDVHVVVFNSLPGGKVVVD
jgi:hypothetical protein